MKNYLSLSRTNVFTPTAKHGLISFKSGYRLSDTDFFIASTFYLQLHSQQKDIMNSKN